MVKNELLLQKKVYIYRFYIPFEHISMFKANYISLFFRLERPESEEVIISS